MQDTAFRVFHLITFRVNLVFDSNFEKARNDKVREEEKEGQQQERCYGEM